MSVELSEKKVTNPAIVVIDGEIGAGKSTLLRELGKELEKSYKVVVTVPEPVDVWAKVGIFQKFCQDPARYAYDFQTFAYSTRVQRIVSCYRADADVIVLERSPLTDRLFMSLLDVSDMHRTMYRSWVDAFTRALPLDLSEATFVYLKPTIEHCMSRILSRARPGEIVDPKATAAAEKKTIVDRKYLERLRQAHAQFFEGKASQDVPPLDIEPSPFSLAKNAAGQTKVVLVEGAMADGDFTSTGPDRDRVVSHVLERVGLGPRNTHADPNPQENDKFSETIKKKGQNENLFTSHHANEIVASTLVESVH